LLKSTKLHPRLEALQYLDFTNPNARPWDALIESLRQAESSKLQQEQAVYQAHEYSGTWEAENVFSRCRGYDLGVNDTVYWQGKMFLLISADGKKGAGTGSGKLYVSIGNYKATYENGARINRAHVTEHRTLNLDLEVLYRVRIEEEGEPPEARFREELFGSGGYHLELKPVGVSKNLQGKHIYKAGNKVYQEAEEHWEYSGF
jgi:hypothetical protein